jgi:hypothetical protein
MEKQSYSARLKNMVTTIDSYGTPINLTYKSKTTFQSFLGGMVTIVCKFIVFAFLVMKLKNVYHKVATI